MSGFVASRLRSSGRAPAALLQPAPTAAEPDQDERQPNLPPPRPDPSREAMERSGDSRWQRLHWLRDAVITLVLLATVAGVWWFAIEGSRQAEEAATEVAFLQAEADAAAADLFVRHLAADSRQFAALAQRWLRLSPPPEDGRRAELEASIRQLLQPGDLSVGHLTIADAQGRIRWHTITDGLNIDVSSHPHFTGHLDGHPGPLVGRPLVKRATGETVVPISWRLEDGSCPGTWCKIADPRRGSRWIRRPRRAA
jgi:hypothetical protein